MSHEPKPPKYRKSGGLYKITFPNKGAGKPTLTPEGLIRFPLGLQVKAWFGIKEFFLPFPENLNFKDVAEFTILPKNGALYLECSYKKEKIQTNLDANQALAIDLGTSANLMACVDTLGNSFLVDSRQAKAMNQLYNKRIATLKEGKCRDYWDKACDRITLKRNNQMRDMVNKAARTTLEHCLTHGIGTIVVGWNQGIKEGANMGRHNNQQFVQMPLVKLKSRIFQLCELYGIRFVETLIGKYVSR